jgi:hypothetical protein
MNPNHIFAEWLNAAARNHHTWSKWCDQWALALWGM